MLEEAVEVMRQLWTGEVVTHHGRHYTVEGARLYTLPDEPVPVPVSAFGSEALKPAARTGDGFITVTPDPDLLRDYRDEGGTGPAMGGVKVCWADDEHKARQLAHERWPTAGVPGELSQELPMPAHFEQAVQNVTEEQVAEAIPCGPDPERHVAALGRYLEAGYDEVYVSQLGPEQSGFVDFYRREVLPRLT